jgi:predicted ester cyclase
LRLEVKQLLVDGSVAAAEGTLAGTHNAVLHSPAGDIPATGKTVELRWGAIYEVRDSEMLYEHLYFDQMELMGQLGLLPS